MGQVLSPTICDTIHMLSDGEAVAQITSLI